MIEVSSIKRLFSILLIVIFCFLLSGCWNYHGLNEISIVAGVAIDRNIENDNYLLTIEIFDLSGKDGVSKAKIIETEGQTIYEAIRNAKKSLTKKLYFSDMQLLVISNQIASEEGIQYLLDWFIRNEKPRETFSIIISQEKTAKEILTASAVDHKVISEEVERILDLDNKVTASTKNIDMYKIVNEFKKENSVFVLPAIHCVTNQDKKIVEVNGVAIFKSDRLQGYLSPEETRYYLFAVDEIKGGILTFPLNEKKQDTISFEIFKNKTKKSYAYDDNRLKVYLDIKTTVAIGENGNNIDLSKKENIDKIKTVATMVFSDKLKALIEKVDKDFACDAFEFGKMVKRKSLVSWSQLNEDWNEYPKNIEVEIRPEFEIINTGLIK